MKSEAREVKAQLAAKTDECSELQEINDKAKTDLEKQTAKLNKQLESLKAKLDKTTEEKKEKVAHVKEITRLHKELENDQKNQIARLTKENKELLKKNSINIAADAKPEEESKLAKKVKALEEEKENNESTVFVGIIIGICSVEHIKIGSVRTLDLWPDKDIAKARFVFLRYRFLHEILVADILLELRVRFA